MHGSLAQPQTNDRPDAELGRLFARIDGFAALDENWDCAGAAAANSDSVERARSILAATYCEAEAAPGAELPSVSLDADGRVHLLWRSGARSALLIVDPDDKRDGVLVKSERSVSTRSDADRAAVIDAILWAFGR